MGCFVAVVLHVQEGDAVDDLVGVDGGFDSFGATVVEGFGL